MSTSTEEPVEPLGASPPAEPRPRMTAEERREQIIDVAVQHFAVKGYVGSSTELIAEEVGISQPYLFRLFKTKRELFLACCKHNHAEIRRLFNDAAGGVVPEDRLEAMRRAYRDMLTDRHNLLKQMQAYAACADPVIRAEVREEFLDLVKHVARLSQSTPEQMWSFFASGMLLGVVAALELEEVASRDGWIADWSSPAAAA